MSKEWWSPGEIIFTRPQVIWLLYYLSQLREGQWPPNPQESGYVDALIGKRSNKAYFETPCQFSAEIDFRLKRTGVEGKLLIAEVKAEYYEFSPEAWRALNYISGWARKEMSYMAWKKQWVRRRSGNEALLSNNI